jgi:hypothetical protein
MSIAPTPSPPIRPQAGADGLESLRPVNIGSGRSIPSVLGRVRRRIRLYIVVRAVLAAVAALAITFWAAFALDYLPVKFGRDELSVEFRWFLAVIAGIAAGACLYQLGLQRLFVSLPDDRLALLLERRFPHLHDSLITAVELKSDEPRGRFAQAMLSRVHDQAGAGLVQVNVSRLFDFRPLYQITALAVCAIAPALALAYFQPEVMRLACERLLLFSPALWPRSTKLEVVGIDVRRGDDDIPLEAMAFTGTSLKAPRGADLTLKVAADTSKYVPNECTVTYKLENGERGTAVMKRLGKPRDGKQIYVASGVPFRRFATSVTFHVIGNDYRIETHRLEAVESPVVTQATMDLRLPDYMVDSAAFQTNERLEIPLLPAGNAAPAGSALTLRFATSKPMAEVVVRDTESGTIVPSSLANGQTEAVASLPSFERNLAIEVSLRDTDGVSATRPHRVFVAALPDKAPRVELDLTGIGAQVTPQVRMPVVVKTVDDFGLASARLDVAVDDKPPQLIPVESEVLNRKSPPLQLDVANPIDILAMAESSPQWQLKPGQKLTVLAQAIDRRNIGDGPNIGLSERREFTVVSPDDLLAVLENRELTFRRRFEEIVEELTEMRDSLVRVKAELSARGSASASASPPAEAGDEKLSPEALANRQKDLRRLRSERASQQIDKSVQETNGIANGFDLLFAEMVNNRLDTTDKETRLREQVAIPLHAIVATDFPECKAKLLELLSKIDVAAAGQSNGDEESCEASIVATNRLLANMDQVLQKMLDLETYNEVLDLVRDLIKTQKEVADQTKRLRDEEDLEK